jgi:hypothetical protein
MDFEAADQANTGSTPARHWTFRFVTSARLSLDARALRANPRLNAFWTSVLILEIVLGVVVAAQGYVLGSFFVILGIVFYAYSYVEPVLLWRIRRRLGSSLGRDVMIAIDESALSYETSLSSGRIPWSTFTAVRATERLVLFMRGRAALAYVPTASFSTAQEREEIIAFVRARIASARTPEDPSRL